MSIKVTVRLYCDEPRPDNPGATCGEQDVFSAPTYDEARKYLAGRGWRYDEATGRHACPKCAGVKA